MTGTDVAQPGAVPRVAYNPIPWAFTAEGYDARAIRAPPELAAYLKPAGFHAVHIEVDFFDLPTPEENLAATSRGCAGRSGPGDPA